MTRKLLPVVLSVAIVGCGLLRKEPTGMDAGPTPSVSTTLSAPSGALAVGDRVVARWGSGSFYEGTVESVGARHVIKWGDGSKASEVEPSDVMPIPKAGSDPQVVVGDFVFARFGSNAWPGAQVTSVAPGAIGVKYASDGTAATVTPEKILKAPPAVAPEIQKQLAQTEFLNKAKASGRPRAPATYKAKVGDTVVAEWITQSWFSGKVKTLKADKATVEWADGSRPTEVAVDKLVPAPDPVKAKAPKAGQFVLARPESGNRWSYAEVSQVDGSRVQIKLPDGKTRTVAPVDCIGLE
jgi:hypothetical protein